MLYFGMGDDFSVSIKLHLSLNTVRPFNISIWFYDAQNRFAVISATFVVVLRMEKHSMKLEFQILADQDGIRWDPDFNDVFVLLLYFW